MSILSDLYRFKTSGALGHLTSTTTEKLSDEMDTGAASLGDGATDLYFVVNCVDVGTAAAGASFTVALKHATTSGGTYSVALSKVVPLADISKGEIFRAKLPASLARYLKASFQGAASMTGGATFEAQIATT